MKFWEFWYTYLGNPEKGKELDDWDDKRWSKQNGTEN